MVWCQFNPSYNELAMELWRRTRKWDFDTSHDISNVETDGTRTKIATFKHADDAALVEQLVNAFKEGKLMISEKPE